MSPLQRLIYCSQATPAVVSDLEAVTTDIIDASIRNNSRIGVTGMLLAHEGWFLQALEGSPAAVETIYHKVRQDARHQNFKMIAHSEANSRAFEGWSMCGRALSRLDDQVMKVLDGSGSLQFRDLAPGEALNLLRTIHGVQLRQVA